MSKKLMTLEELAEYLGTNKEKVIVLVEQEVIPAYKIAGELLRFQKEQIDAVRSEIDSLLSFNNGEIKTRKEKLKSLGYRRSGENNTFLDKIRDFFYFNDFYIFSGMLIIILLLIIIRG